MNFCDYVVIVVQAEALSLLGLPQVFNYINNCKRGFSRDIKIAGILITMYNGVLKVSKAMLQQLVKLCEEWKLVLVEDAAESLGATYKGKQTGTFGKYAIVSYNGNKLITGSSGGALLTNDKDAADKVRKWSTQAREAAPWYQHEELGYNYRMSNIIAGIVRGQYEHIEEHIALYRHKGAHYSSRCYLKAVEILGVEIGKMLLEYVLELVGYGIIDYSRGLGK